MLVDPGPPTLAPPDAAAPVPLPGAYLPTADRASTSAAWNQRDPAARVTASSGCMTQERWTTLDDLHAARERFAAAIPGWRQPVAQALGVVRRGDDGAELPVEFPVVNTAQHRLPVVVLGGVLRHVDRTATYEVSLAELDRAIDVLAPAEAVTSVDHPNLAAWRVIREELAVTPGTRAVAVFVADLADPVSGPYDAALRARLAEA